MNVSHSSHISLALLFTAALCALTQTGCGGTTTIAKATPTPVTPAAQQILFLPDGVTSTAAFMLNADGSLTAVAGSPFSIGGNGAKADGAGKFLFTEGGTKLTTNTVSSTGMLAAASSLTDATLSGAISVNPSGTALYVSSVSAAQSNSGWKTYSIQANGTLQFVSGQVSQVDGPLVFTSDGLNAYNATCFHLSANIAHFTAAANGSLTSTGEQVALVPSANGSECPQTAAVNPAGDTLASAWREAGAGPAHNAIALYAINPSTHALAFTSASPFPASGVGQDLKYDASGKFIVLAQESGIGVYNAGTNSVSEITGSPFASGTNFSRLMFSPSGSFVVAVSQVSQQVSVFAFNSSTGTLTRAPGSPHSVTIAFDLAMIQR